MADDYNEHIKAVKMQLMNAILNASPRFFEVLVLELLMKIGYGYDEDSGKVTRYCKDGGIDGIIEEDKLGLDKIYIQADEENVTTHQWFQCEIVVAMTIFYLPMSSL